MDEDGLGRNSMSGEKVFFDTNILVYFVDGNDTRKQNIAKVLDCDSQGRMNERVAKKTLCCYNA